MIVSISAVEDVVSARRVRRVERVAVEPVVASATFEDVVSAADVADEARRITHEEVVPIATPKLVIARGDVPGLFPQILEDGSPGVSEDDVVLAASAKKIVSSLDLHQLPVFDELEVVRTDVADGVAIEQIVPRLSVKFVDASQQPLPDLKTLLRPRREQVAPGIARQQIMALTAKEGVIPAGKLSATFALRVAAGIAVKDIVAAPALQKVVARAKVGLGTSVDEVELRVPEEAIVTASSMEFVIATYIEAVGDDLENASSRVADEEIIPTTASKDVVAAAEVGFAL